MLGPFDVTFHSQDDKCKVTIGITAGNKQAPLIMHMEYQVVLPDLDFVVAPGHKLILSAFGSMSVKKNGPNIDAVTYSGSTYVAMRNAKLSGSSIFHHLHSK